MVSSAIVIGKTIVLRSAQLVLFGDLLNHSGQNRSFTEMGAA
jgi:hypothetical protein